MIDEKTKIENFDILLKNIDDIGSFNISFTLEKGLGINADNLEREKLGWFLDLTNAIENFGMAHRYFEETYPVTYRLTEKGIKAKDLGGHLKYKKSVNKTPLTLYQKIYLPIFILFGLLSVYNRFFPAVSKSEFQNLKTEFQNTNYRFDSLIDENTKKTSAKIKLLNDTLQTKNSGDLKND
ncbi:hypothetical protein ACKGJY_15285 [Hyunsoonleella sp. 2307UL5-6]|uniref:hypothetical protein n=1 Tax=Hyunsoonleella sp. 2307UL5-6 TaxID=3384768 RepID=UPI0039BCB271